MSEAINASEEPWEPLVKYKLKEDPVVQSQTVNDVWKYTLQREVFRYRYYQGPRELHFHA